MYRKLTQEVCKVCFEKCYIKWKADDEIAWLKGKVRCPAIVSKNFPSCASIYKEPPEWCQYKLEHMVGSE